MLQVTAMHLQNNTVSERALLRAQQGVFPIMLKIPHVFKTDISQAEVGLTGAGNFPRVTN